MITERDLWRYALMLFDEHGNEAFSIISERLVETSQADDQISFDLWRAIEHRIQIVDARSIAHE